MADFTNFCCRSGGDNTNAGTRTGNTTVPGTGADLTYAGGTWVSATRVLTVASGDPVVDGVAVGDFASVYTAGATETGFVGRVSARTTTTITIDGTAKVGTSPADGTRTLKIGGAWAGPSGTNAFPFNIGSGLGACMNSSGNPVRMNFKADLSPMLPTATWAINNTSGPRVTWQGFTTAYGDLAGTGNAVQIQGPSTGASFVVMTLTTNNQLVDLDFFQNGSTGTADGVTAANTAPTLIRCSFRNMKGSGGSFGSGDGAIIECQFDSNGTNGATGNSLIVRSSFTRNGARGYSSAANITTVTDSVFADNVTDGLIAGGILRLFNSNFYNNGGNGIINSGAGVVVYAESCNFLKNTTTGVLNNGSNSLTVLMNCGFGTGTQANGADTNVAALVNVGPISYASNVTPWVDPANGDFTTNLAAAQGTGYGEFLNRASGYGGTLNYPNVGASQQAPVTPGGLIRPVAAGGGLI